MTARANFRRPPPSPFAFNGRHITLDTPTTHTCRRAHSAIGASQASTRHPAACLVSRAHAQRMWCGVHTKFAFRARPGSCLMRAEGGERVTRAHMRPAADRRRSAA
eukprot:4479334-Prymnesium_polylepis.1